MRVAVRRLLAEVRPAGVLVACSGGADSVALAAATAFEAPRLGVPAGLVTVDHGLQPGSAAWAAETAELGRGLGLDPVLVRRVEPSDIEAIGRLYFAAYPRGVPGDSLEEAVSDITASFAGEYGEPWPDACLVAGIAGGEIVG